MFEHTFCRLSSPCVFGIEILVAEVPPMKPQGICRSSQAEAVDLGFDSAFSTIPDTLTDLEKIHASSIRS
jgi:hypothetical protein